MYNIDEHYKLTKSVFDKNIDKIFQDIAFSKYPKSCEALFFCQKKIDLFLLIIEQKNDSNYYIFQSITRCIFEHFLVGHYIWTKTRIDENDVCGQEYYQHYKISEFFKRENYNLRIEGIEKNIKNYNSFENLKNRLPEFENFTQNDLSEYHRIANQFDIRYILDYILNKIPDNDIFKEAHKYFISFLKEYNKLSSFIHGGPLAEEETFKNQPSVKKTQIIEDNIKWSKTASRLIKEHIIFLLLDYEGYFYKKLFAPIIEYMQQK